MRRARSLVIGFVGVLAFGGGSAHAATIIPTPGFVNDNFTDDANCSLREAIQVANTNLPGAEDACGVSGTLGDDTVQLGAGTYLLQLGEDASPDDNAQGDLDVFGGPLTLDGQEAGVTTINAAASVPPSRTLHGIGVPLTVRELTVTGGHPTGAIQLGGGIYSVDTPGSVSLVRAVVSGNSALAGGGIYAGFLPLSIDDSDVTANSAGSGGGIAANGATTISNGSLIQDNTATGNLGGGGISFDNGSLTMEGSVVNDNHATLGFGGGIAISNATVAISNSEVSDNDAAASNAGGGIQNFGDLSITGATEISDNEAGSGGGISSSPGATLTISGAVSLSGNGTIGTLFPTGGAIVASGSTTIDGATLEDNDAGGGGAIAFNAAAPEALEISNSRIAENSASSHAGAIQTNGLTSITGSEISTNVINVPDDAIDSIHTAGAIGVEASGVATITDTTITNNAAATTDPDDGLAGGGIANRGELTLRRSTLSGNQLLGGSGTHDGAGIYVSGGINETDTRLENTTVSGNSTGSFGRGGGVYLAGDGLLLLLHTTVAGNSATTADAIKNEDSTLIGGSIIDEGPSGCEGPGTFTANAHTVDAGTSCVGAFDDTDLESIDPMLGGLTDNGGPTRTRALLPGSPAIDAVPSATFCTDLNDDPFTVDQRGFPRPFPSGGDCDAGAYESFSCSGVVQNPPGPFVGCPAPGPGGGLQGVTPPSPAPTPKRCRKGFKLKKVKGKKKKRCVRKKRKRR